MEISDLQNQVKIDEERALSQHVPDNLLNVLVIVKRPLLALRYTLPNGQIRKTQMNFSPHSGCDTALENFRVAGLPVRDRDLAQVESQHQEPSQSQSRSQERPGSLNVHQFASRQSSQDAFPGSSQYLGQDGTGVRNTGYGSLPQFTQPAQVNIRPISAPGGSNQDEFSKPISASSGSTLNALGSSITVTSAPIVANPRKKPNLLPSPVLDGTYAPFGSFQVRPGSAPEPAQTQQSDTNTLPLSQTLPPAQDRPVSEKETHLFLRDESALQEKKSQEQTAVPKTKAKRQTKPRAQPAKPRKSRAKNGTTDLSCHRGPLPMDSPSSNSYATCKAPSSSGFAEAHTMTKAPSPSAPPKLSFPQSQNLLPMSELPVSPSINSRKHSWIDQSVNQPNKRLAPARVETVTEKTTEIVAATRVAEQPPQAQPAKVKGLTLDDKSQDLLQEIDTVMRKQHEKSIDNLMRKYHNISAPRLPSQAPKEHLSENKTHSDDDDHAKALDDLVFKCMNDETFEKLMDGVEGAWKRIGLGFDEQGENRVGLRG